MTPLTDEELYSHVDYLPQPVQCPQDTQGGHWDASDTTCALLACAMLLCVVGWLLAGGRL